ncbi:transient receptor potential cation channel subfamily M member 2-like [Alosa pseudoharengus]|uniref:transient receptor potential cation channel subfamily M member 2-like n=1 Tax=Alosa pseudoharengus TaxID=34774 RepID=UPI003F8B4368
MFVAFLFECGRLRELCASWHLVRTDFLIVKTERHVPLSGDLHKAMSLALVNHKSEFVRLLLKNGVSIPQFLSREEKLRELYTNMPDCLFLRRLQGNKGCQQRVSLPAVAVMVRQLLGRFTQPIYSSPLGKVINMADEDHNTVIRDPGRDFFLWAILQNNRELAQIAWEQNPEVRQVFNLESTSHKDVIQVHKNERPVTQNTVHELLECLGGVFLPKWYAEELKQT